MFDIFRVIVLTAKHTHIQTYTRGIDNNNYYYYFPYLTQPFLLLDPHMPPKSVLSLTRKKQKPSEKVIAMSKENMKLEYEFYDFIKERFHKLKRSLDIQ
jgi:hypothetical protein